MAFLSIIRRWHKRDHVPIREISRRTGVSRNTVRKYLRSGVIEPKFQVVPSQNLIRACGSAWRWCSRLRAANST
jgi:transposase